MWQALPHDALYALQEPAPHAGSDSSVLSTDGLHKWLPFWRRHSHDSNAAPVPAPRPQPGATQMARPPVHGHILDSNASGNSNRLASRSSFGGEADSFHLPPKPPRAGAVAHRRKPPQKSAIARGLGEAVEQGAHCTPPPMQPPMCAGSADSAQQCSTKDREDQALFAELGLGGGGGSPVFIKGSQTQGSRVTDLRSRAARERMGALLRRTGFRGPTVLTGARAQRVWGQIAANAELPPHLQQELAAYLAARRRGHACDSEDELLSPASIGAPEQHGAAPGHCPLHGRRQPVAEGAEACSAQRDGSVGEAHRLSPQAAQALQAAHGARQRQPGPVAEARDSDAAPGSRPRSGGAAGVGPLPRTGSNVPSSGSTNRHTRAASNVPAHAANGTAPGGGPRVQELADSTPFTAGASAHHRRNTSVPLIGNAEMWVDADAADGRHTPQKCALAHRESACAA